MFWLISDKMLPSNSCHCPMREYLRYQDSQCSGEDAYDYRFEGSMVPTLMLLSALS